MRIDSPGAALVRMLAPGDSADWGARADAHREHLLSRARVAGPQEPIKRKAPACQAGASLIDHPGAIEMIASVNAHESESVKPRARKSAKAPARQPAPKVKASLLIPAEAHQRLCIHAAMLGVDRSELVTRLINEHLRRYVVQDRRPGESAGPVDTADIGS